MPRSIHYFDHAATTPLDPRVLRAMQPYLTREFGNPSNLYSLGRRAKRAIMAAADQIAGALGCKPGEIIFTGSATEADNMALQGAVKAIRKMRMRPDGSADPGRIKIIVSEIEHKGILAVAAALEKEGVEVVKIPVKKDGLVDLKKLEAALDDRTVLVSVTSADSETGILQPVAEIGKIVRKFRDKDKVTGIKEEKNSPLSLSPYPCPIFHTDASQAAAFLDLNVDELGVDLLTLSAHKLGGPKGIGALYVRQGTPLEPIIYGGGQQAKLRSGTENVPGIVGFGEAMAIAARERGRESARVRKLRDRLERGIMKSIPKVVLNGHPTKRLPNFLNISILDIEGEAMLLYLDDLGIYVNTGSACNSESLEPSYVLTALGEPYEYVHGSIRFTLGHETTAADVDYVLQQLPPIVKKLRQISPLNLSLGQKEKMSQPKAFIGGQTPHFLRKRKENEERRKGTGTNHS